MVFATLSQRLWKIESQNVLNLHNLIISAAARAADMFKQIKSRRIARSWFVTWGSHLAHDDDRIQGHTGKDRTRQLIGHMQDIIGNPRRVGQSEHRPPTLCLFG